MGAGRGRPLVVGILNATPDSFFDGGQHADLIAHGERLIAQGADWLDIGGESTRPGAPSVSADEECGRILPVIRALAGTVPLSVDTSKASVAAEALRAGAQIINDVTGLSDPEMPAVTADAEATIVMHMRGNPKTMGAQTKYQDVVSEVRDWLLSRASQSRSAVTWIDPGIGFAKTAEQSLALLGGVEQLTSTGLPVLIGASRKSFIGHVLRLPDPATRLSGSLAAAAAAWLGGAQALRVHDVAETRQVLDLLHAINQAGQVGPDSIP
jgi:dihydropteroate synthase